MTIWDEFPFERVEWDNWQYMRLKGYSNPAMMEMFAIPLEEWMKKLKLEYDILKTSVEVFHGVPDPIVIPNDIYKELVEKAWKYDELDR